MCWIYHGEIYWEITELFLIRLHPHPALSLKGEGIVVILRGAAPLLNSHFFSRERGKSCYQRDCVLLKLLLFIYPNGKD
jgi:hypothetical protein